MINDMLNGPVILDDRKTGYNYIKWITRTIACSFGYKGCYELTTADVTLPARIAML
jgi:hypothetical protein